jgi:CubicO group peptidase (beta-lactamase class C family)
MAQRLDRVAAEKIYRPLGLGDDLFFLPLCEARPDRRYAAMEDCPWRGKILVGEVHDDNAHALGGVAGHAGLFGTVQGVLALTTHLLEVWQARARPVGFHAAELRHFLTTRPVADSTWVLGFDTPSATGSSAGHHFSSASVGHLGFTGTSFWIDPVKELVVVLLTNRVHPVRHDERIKTFRPRFHDEVMAGLGLI